MIVSISMRKDLVDAIDDIAEEVGISRSEVIEEFIRFILDEGLDEEIFPYEEEEEEESEESEEEK